MANPAVKTAADAVIRELESLANPANVAGMARYGIRSAKALGVSAPVLRAMAKRLGTDHALAAELWRTGYLEARGLAALIDDPARVTPAQMAHWAKGFDSWAACDAACCVLFDRTPYAIEHALAWSRRDEEYIKRAGFVLMAGMAMHVKDAPDEVFLEFLGVVERKADDPRNMVKKGVNWALRQIGKRNPALNTAAVRVARRLAARPDAASRWVGHDALRELTNPATRTRVAARARGRARQPKRSNS